MKLDKTIIITIFLLGLLMIGAVNAASDNNDTLSSDITEKPQTHTNNQIDKTITILDNAIASLNDQMEKEGIIEKLNRIEEKCEILRNWAK